MYFFEKFRQLYKPFSQRVFALESKTIPPFDSKFNVNSENGVIFEIEGARFWDIEQYMQHGRFGTPEAYGCQGVILKSWNSHFGRFYGFYHGLWPNFTFSLDFWHFF